MIHPKEERGHDTGQEQFEIRDCQALQQDFPTQITADIVFPHTLAEKVQPTMEQGHRYRLLLYFAALVICLSVCFAYAEEPAALTVRVALPAEGPARVASMESTHLLFSTMPGRSSFLPELRTELVATAAEPVTAASADAVLQKLDGLESRSHGFLHMPLRSRHKLKLVKARGTEHLSASTASAQVAAETDGD